MGQPTRGFASTSAAIVAGVLLPALAAAPARGVQASIEWYQSSYDGAALRMTLIFPEAPAHSPVLAVMHGYAGDAPDVYPTQVMLAERGLFTVAPSMRGRDGSGGSPDDSAWELQDIVDALAVAVERYPERVDAGNLNVVGYSGGGGNVFGCISKFPDTFRLAAAFFGIADYGHDPVHGWYQDGGSGCCQAMMRERIGGAPAEVPHAYLARDALLAVRNNRHTATQLYVDSEETLCPAYYDTAYVGRAKALGHANVSLHLSTPDSTYRWTHGYPNEVPDLAEAFDRFVPGILAGAYPEPRIDPTGRLTVLGFVTVRDFSLILGDGRAEAADLRYDVSGGSPEDARWFEVRSLTGAIAPAVLRLRGLAPHCPYVFQNEDLTHGTLDEEILWTDGAGRLEAAATIDSVSVLRTFREPSGLQEPATRPGAPRLVLSPNPFTDRLTVRFESTRPTAGTLRVYDAAGRLAATLAPAAGDPGVTIYQWTPRGSAAGRYYLEAPEGEVGRRSAVRLR